MHILWRRQLRPPREETTVPRVVKSRARGGSMCPALGPLLLAHHAERPRVLCCHCRKAALQVSMNDGLSFISSSVIITTTHCVSRHLSFYRKLHYPSHLPGKFSGSAFCSLNFNPSTARPATGWARGVLHPRVYQERLCLASLGFPLLRLRVIPEHIGMTKW